MTTTALDTPVPVPIAKKENASLPRYATEHSAGADICACVESPTPLLPGKRMLVPTGLFAEIPHGYEIQIRPRSGLALKHGITLVNTPGTIDADYRGEIGVILINHGDVPFMIEPGMRIAQIVLAKVTTGQFFETTETLSETKRGEGGFGHSGTN